MTALVMYSVLHLFDVFLPQVNQPFFFQLAWLNYDSLLAIQMIEMLSWLVTKEIYGENNLGFYF